LILAAAGGGSSSVMEGIFSGLIFGWLRGSSMMEGFSADFDLLAVWWRQQQVAIQRG